MTSPLPNPFVFNATNITSHATLYACPRRLFWSKEAALNIPNLLLLVAAIVAFFLEVSEVWDKPKGYFNDRCNAYLAATTYQEQVRRRASMDVDTEQ